MNRVTFPLRAPMQGPTVGDLQEALEQFLRRGALLANDEVARREQLPLLKRERLVQTYGEVTHKLVRVFQEERRLQASGEVDEPTANAINTLLKELGLLEPTNTTKSYVVSGTVRREDGLALGKLRVQAFHDAGRDAIRLGEDTTDVEGRYTIRYESLPGMDGINLGVSVLNEDGKLLRSSDVVRNAKPLETVDLSVPVIGAPRIEGTIVLEHGLQGENLKLRLYRRDFGGKATLLNETTTLAGGRYAFTYDAKSVAASLEVRAVNRDGQEIALSKPLNELTVESRTNLNLVAPGDLQPLLTEYRRLSDDLTPHVGEMKKLAGAKENSTQQDLTVLNRATGWDARLIALASITERLADDPDVKNAGLPSEALYGLLRAGLPSDKLLLAQVEPDVVEMGLKKVRDAGIVNVTDADMAEIKTKFTIFANKTRMAMPVPGSQSTYGELLRSSGLSQDAQDKFAPIYLRHRGSGDELWDAVRKDRLGIPEDSADSVDRPNDRRLEALVGKLRLQGKLAFLAGNSEAMTTRLMKKGLQDPVGLVRQDFHGAAAWKNEVFEQAGVPQDRRANLTDADRKNLDAVIPTAYAGEKVEARLETYAEDMARKVRLSYPTQVVGRLVESDQKFKLPSAHAATVTLLKTAVAQGFRFGETPTATFLKSHPDLQDGLNPAEFREATQQIKALQRVYQITPSDEAMPVLMELGITSAFDVMGYPEDRFVALFEAKYFTMHNKTAPAGVAELVIRKAKQVSSVTYNLFAIAKKIESEPPIFGLSAPVQVRESVKNELIKHYPTMESLFGSMDYCECEHCRSVLSPAAYLVDLLQFLDTEPGVWTNFLDDWEAKHDRATYKADWNKKPDGSSRKREERKPYDALIERRPDLPHIALTCENTHTALPYIDIVNEILEYYVANDKLDEKAAHDTGDASTVELLTEPQNVIPKAYDALRAARYPLNLPFDLWIETVRQFCNYFDMPLHRVLECFRPTDDLFAPTQIFDRATIFTESLGLSGAEVEILAEGDPLTSDKWHVLYGFPSVRAAIQNPTNAGNATLAVTNPDAGKYRAGLAYTYFDTSANSLRHAESKILASIGAPDSGGAGRTTLTLEGVWTVAPDPGDLLVCDVPAMLKSAKTLSRRLGVSYKEIVEIVQTGFVNPALGKLALLYKLDVGVRDAKLHKDEKKFYEANKDFYEKNKGKNRSDLSLVDQQRFDELAKNRPNREITGWQILDEVAAFEQRLQVFAKEFYPLLGDAELKGKIEKFRTDIEAMPFDKALVLADPDAGCNFDQTTLQYADGTAADPIVFLRINLFVRLWRKLGWSIEETDSALTAFIPQSAPIDGTAASLAKQPLKTALIYLAHLKALDEKLKVGKQSRLKLLTLWSDIATTGKKALYAQLFLTRSVLKSDAVFDDALGNYLQYFNTVANKYKPFQWNPTQSENPATGNVSLKSHQLALQEAVGLTAEDISHILTDADTSLEKAELSLPNVSLLYRYGLLAKALKLTMRELIALKQLSGLDPFKALHPEPLADSPAGVVPPQKAIDLDHPFSQTIEFVKVVEEVKDSGLKIEDLDYLLRHRFDETGKYRPNRESTLALLKSLSEGVRAIRAEHAVPDDPTALSDEALWQKLGLALPTDVLATFTAMLNRTAEFTATRAVASADQLHPADFSGESSIIVLPYNGTKNQQALVHRGVLFDSEKAELKAKFGAKLPVGKKATFEALLDDTQAKAEQEAHAFFDLHLRKQTGSQPERGFLEAADFEFLFARPFDIDLSEPVRVAIDGISALEEPVKDVIKNQFSAHDIPLSDAARVAKNRENFWRLTDNGRGFTLSKVDTLHVELQARSFDVDLSAPEQLPLRSALEGIANAGEVPDTIKGEFTARGISLSNQATIAKDGGNLWRLTDNGSIFTISRIRELNVSIEKVSVVARAFFPFLQQRLIRQFIVQTMTAQTGADPMLVESLLTDERLLGGPEPLLDAFATTAERSLTTTFFASADATGAALATVSLVDADTGSKDKDGNPLKPAGANSARLEGYFVVPATGAYRFYIELDKKNAEAELSFPHLPEPVFLEGAAAADHVTLGDQPDEFLELKGGVPYRFSLDLRKLDVGDARLLVQGETLPKGPLSQLMLYPTAAIEDAERAMILLSKALQLVQSLSLSEREIRYLLTHAADFGGVSLSELPTLRVGDTPAEKSATTQRFRRFRRLAAYARLKRDLAGGTDDLIGIFEASPTMTSVERQNVPFANRLLANTFGAHPKLSVHYNAQIQVQRLTYDGALGDVEAAQIKELLPGSALLASLIDELRTTLPDRLRKIAKLTRRDEATVKSCAAALFSGTDFRSEEPLWSLWEALQVVERFGVPPASLLGWADIIRSTSTGARRFELARDVKEAIKARFEPEAWQRVAQPIFDKLRQRQRDALVSHVMQQHGFDRMEQLYEHFLIDPGMEPLVQTSRIRLAISSLQLFIQRCLLNLEPKVHPSAIINSKQWEWVKRYRVWEANRKIFLFPENWLEPEFRDDKTHLFTELEGALLQGDVSSDLVEDAFLNYLRKLDELARLDICAMHIEDNVDPALRVLHVFGRTYSQPHKYFYRRYAHQMWTPWEPVSAEIEGDHLAPVVWRDRLYLFWVTFLEKAVSPTSDTTIDPTKTVTIPIVKKDVEAQLHWSEYLQGEWTTRESSDFSAPSPVRIPNVTSFDSKSVFIDVSKDYHQIDGAELGVFIRLGGAIQQAFYLAGRNSAPEKSDGGSSPDNSYLRAKKITANRYSGSGRLSIPIAFDHFNDSIKGPDILKEGDEYTLLPCNNIPALNSSGRSTFFNRPVFYQDNRHTFFVEPNVTETTTKQKEGWVKGAPQPEPEFRLPDWWKDHVIIQEIVVHDPKGPIWNPPSIDKVSIIEPKDEWDWLVNPVTAIKFDNVLIGSIGQLGIELLTGNGPAVNQGHVHVNPGSGLAVGSTVVVRDMATFANPG